MSQEVPIVLEHGAAPGAVHGDEVRLARLGNIGPSQRLGGSAIPRVLMQGATTLGERGLHDRVSIYLKSASRRLMDVGEKSVHDTTAKEHDRSVFEGTRDRGLGWRPG